MKKYFLTAVIFLAAIIFLPTKAAAQYSIMPGYYSLQYGLEYAKASRRAASIRNGRRSAKRKAIRKKVVRRKSRRVSMLENVTAPKMKLNAELPKRIEIG